MKEITEEDRVQKRKRVNNFDASKYPNDFMHIPISMSKLQSKSGSVFTDLTNLPVQMDSRGSVKRSEESMPPPIARCKENPNIRNVSATKRSKLCNEVFITNNTQAGIKGLSPYGQGSNIKEKKHFSYTGTKKAFPSILTSTSTTIPLKRIFGRILRDLQNLPQNTVPNGYHSPSLLSPYSTSEHCKSQTSQRDTDLNSGTKKRSNGVRKASANSVSRQRQTALVIGTNKSRISDPSQDGNSSDKLTSTEVPSESEDEQFYDLSSQESDTVSNNSDHD
ncbi:Uncharacterized protein Rs2_01385 [Raphanus sativus]|nr:Uncharacterized protein Rs2_18869 [Raphanus sativus]KAJ4915832.1 Uncharacterized protein Rs2_01382 [Raphanus sativus]KAJ4915835.1 Uncharacterized protein Rs2_01385 [Raphanus sativus]